MAVGAKEVQPGEVDSKRCASTDGGYGVIDHEELDGKGSATGVVDINAAKVLA